MKYMGSKNRIAKHILPIMLGCRKEGQCWVEPFVGGGNMIDKVTGPRLGIDSNELAISGLTNIRDNIDLMPKNNKEFTEVDYNNRAVNYRIIKGFAAFAYSYGGKMWGGWCRDGAGKRDYVAEAYRNAVKQSPKLQGCIFACLQYTDFDPPPNSLVYCDPPYKDATSYKERFDHGHFWAWCKQLVANGHIVFVSEYEAPSDWACLWQGEIKSSLTKDTGSKVSVEKLFTLDSY